MGSFARSYKIFWRTLKLIVILFGAFNAFSFWQKIKSGSNEKIPVLASFKQLTSMTGLIAEIKKTCPECLTNPQRMAEELQRRQAIQIPGGNGAESGSLEQAKREIQKALNGGYEPRLAETQTTRAMDAYFAAHRPEDKKVDELTGKEKPVANEEGAKEPSGGTHPLGSVSAMMETLKKAQEGMKDRNRALKQIEEEL